MDRLCRASHNRLVETECSSTFCPSIGIGSLWLGRIWQEPRRYQALRCSDEGSQWKMRDASFAGLG